MLTEFKVRCRSVKETIEVLNFLFENGHAWRGGSKHANLSKYEADNLVGLYVTDAEDYDCYHPQEGMVTFETSEVAFWSAECDLPAYSIEYIQEYYKGLNKCSKHK